MCMSSPSIPEYTPPPPPPEQPKQVDQEMQFARDTQRKQSRLAAGRSSTMLTGGKGLQSEAQTKQKTLLGS